MGVPVRFGFKKPADAEAAHELLRRYARTYAQLDAEEIPDKELILAPWLSECSYTMVSAARGLGKTWWLMDMGVHIVHGLPFCGWEVTKPCSVLYVAGEMTTKHMQKRLRKLHHGLEPAKGHEIILISSEYFITKHIEAPALARDIWRDAMRTYIEDNKDIKVVIFDTVSALFGGLDENSKEAWGDCDQWLNSLRFIGVSPIIVHHLGKNGTPRGTSSREDSLDNSILLRHQAGYKQSDGCKFNIEFTKARNNDGAELDTKTVALVGKSTDPFAHFEAENEGLGEMLEKLSKGNKKTQIAKEMGISRTQLYRTLEKAGL